MSLRARLLILLKIPTSPHIPPGEEAHCTVFRASPNYFNLLRLRWGLGQAGAIVGLIAGFFLLETVVTHAHGLKALPTWVWMALEYFAVISFLTQMPVSYLMLRWDYECRYYMLTDRCVRIQQGLWTFKEQTFTLANIQNLDVHQNPLQRFLGLSDLLIHTAGGGDRKPDEGHKSESLHEGRLQGISDAETLRQRVLLQMKQFKDAGLGDPDKPREVLEHERLCQVEEVTREARLLSESLRL